MSRTRKDQRTLWSLRCVECDKLLEKTPSGFWACPRGHGRLHVEELPEVEYEGLAMFPDDPEHPHAA